MKKRIFKTGANRNSDENKLDYEGFISPLVELVYANYLHLHRLLEDGSMRDSDNWQKGIPKKELMKSAHRHWQDIRLLFDGYKVAEGQKEITMVEALCGMKFNIDAMIHAEMTQEGKIKPEDSVILQRNFYGK